MRRAVAGYAMPAVIRRVAGRSVAAQLPSPAFSAVSAAAGMTYQRRWGCPYSGEGTTASSTANAAGPSPTATDEAPSSGGCPMMGGAKIDKGAGGCPVESAEESAAPVAQTPMQIVNTLGKQRLSAFVTSTASAGYVLSGGTSLPVLVAVTAGTYLQSLSANTSNQCIEIENDRMMKRTHKRPLVTGAITRPQALTLAATELSVGTGLLYATCGPTVAALGIANWVMYVCVYTPLKQVSTTNTWWGAIVGAIPPLMGGVAAAGSLTAASMPPAYLLGAVLFVWQIPHFMSLAYFCRRDYEKAGFKMLPYSNPTRASMYAVALSVVMAGLTLPAPAMIGVAVEPWFYAASAACNAGMVYKSVLFHMQPEKYCRSCFVFSYMYLAVMLGFMIANHFQPQTALTHLVRHHIMGEPVAAREGGSNPEATE